jgi:hypothetical protein
MPVYEFTSPAGKTVRVEVGEGATPDAFAQITDQFVGQVTGQAIDTRRARKVETR